MKASNTSSNADDASKGIPVSVWDEELCMFRVDQSKGKSLSSGGFGVPISSPLHPQSDDNNNVDVDQKPLDTSHGSTATTTTTTTNFTSITRDHLFLEEAIFLHEQGLLKCRRRQQHHHHQEQQHHHHHQQQEEETKKDNEMMTTTPKINTTNTTAWTKLDLFALYSLFPKANLSLAIYLTYAHLRAQTYRVLRHSPLRRPILQAQEDYLQNRNNNTNCSNNNNNNKTFQELKRQLRHNLQSTPAPQVHSALLSSGPNMNTSTTTNNNNTNNQEEHLQLQQHSQLSLQPAFDVYPPQSTFSKSHPGLPDFHVIAFYYAELLPHLVPSLYQLAHACEPIPLKVATVSDSGVVVMFGLSTVGVPTLHDSNT